jgi:6-phosphogluconolactonase
VRVDGAPKPPPSRVTFTLPLLNAARTVVFLVSGRAKRQALARVLSGDRSIPGACVDPPGGERLFFLDRAAAGED